VRKATIGDLRACAASSTGEAEMGEDRMQGLDGGAVCRWEPGGVNGEAVAEADGGRGWEAFGEMFGLGAGNPPEILEEGVNGFRGVKEWAGGLSWTVSSGSWKGVLMRSRCRTGRG
jgi:hypothetical protein